MKESRLLKHCVSLLAVVVLLALAVGSVDSDSGGAAAPSGSPASTAQTQAAPTKVQPDGKQGEREAFIQKLITQGVFLKAEVPGNLPHLWVTPTFYALDFDTKSKFVNVVYAYYIMKDPMLNMVVLYDSQTGKKVGVYAEEYGGLKLD